MQQHTQNAALLVMDVEMGILSNLADTSYFLKKAAKAIEAARSVAIPVIYVIVGFRQGADT